MSVAGAKQKRVSKVIRFLIGYEADRPSQWGHSAAARKSYDAIRYLNLYIESHVAGEGLFRLTCEPQCPASTGAFNALGGLRMMNGSGARHRMVMLRMKKAFL